MSRRRDGLLDTSALILLGKISDTSVLPERARISAVTLAELSVGPLVTDDPAKRGQRLAHVLQAEAEFEALPFDSHAARAFGRVAADLRRSGRKVAARTFDAMIAAIALANGLPLYTCNPDDFAGIDGLDLVAIPHPDR